MLEFYAQFSEPCGSMWGFSFGSGGVRGAPRAPHACLRMPFMAFLLLPPDVFLEIAEGLDLADAIALTSGHLHQVRRDQMHPVALPVGQDLSNLTVVEMREAGMRTNRLMKNWSSETPKPESVREIHMDSMADIIVIPGTGLVIAWSRVFVACWDISSKACVGRMILDCDLKVEAASFEEYGKVMLGAHYSSPKNVYESSVFHVAAICIDYRDRAAVSIFFVLNHPSPFLKRNGDIFKAGASQVGVDHSTVRVVVATYSQPYTYHLLSVSFAGDERVIENVLPQTSQEQTYPPRGPPQVSSIQSPDGGLYFMRHMQRYADIAHLPPSPTDVEPSISEVAVRIPHDSRQIKIYTPAASTAEVVNITIGESMVEFWHARPTITGLNFDVSNYFIDWPSNRAVVGVSGVYTLFSVANYVALGRAESPWRLLRYVPGESPVVRDLKVPGKTLHLNEGRLAVDDHLGLILSLRGDGTLRVVSYA
ncbi:hypothetical protein K438DRAFT_2014680 [Mycena galopus ATCC 62051]|nr:hypothetical protein K438DRAFT_2014680 [Mycena galopus ATCC 62051]